MSERLHYLLPSFKNCRLSHLQDIMYGKKKVLHQSNVTARKVPSWPELSLKRCYTTVTQCCPEIMNYLPNPSKHNDYQIDRDFFW